MKKQINILGTFVIIITTACSLQKNVKDGTATTQKEELESAEKYTLVTTKKEELVTVDTDSVVSFIVEQKKIPEMNLNVLIFHYDSTSAPIEGIRTALLVSSNNSSNTAILHESGSQIFLDSNQKVIRSFINKDMTDSICRKIFYADQKVDHD